jgi:hypothetical protein
MKLTEVHERLGVMAGEWEGQTKTWFNPSAKPDESPWRVSVRPLLGGGFLEQTHEGRLGDRTFYGHVIYGYNSYSRRITAAWIDSFHTGDAMMISEGDVPASASDLLNVVGAYTDRDSGEIWRWRTIAQMPDSDRLILLAFDISPAGQEDRALETHLTRVR